MPVCVEGAKCAKYNMYMRWWNGTHMVITRHVMRPIYARVCRGGEMREIQHVYALVERYAHGNYAPCNAPHLRPCVSRGVAPISTYCPYRARYLLNPSHGGNPGCRSPSVCFTLG